MLKAIRCILPTLQAGIENRPAIAVPSLYQVYVFGVVCQQNQELEPVLHGAGAARLPETSGSVLTQLPPFNYQKTSVSFAVYNFYASRKNPFRSFTNNFCRKISPQNDLIKDYNKIQWLRQMCALKVLFRIRQM